MGNQRPRIMEAQDIRQLLTWQADAARRARRAGLDIVYVYAGMGYLPYEFLLPEWNHRTDAYGGSLANRVRIVRELLEVTHEAVQGKCAVALRISLEELRGRASEAAPSEAHELVELIAELPDLWDVKLDSSPTDCAPSRFTPEAVTSRSSTSLRSSPPSQSSASDASPPPTRWWVRSSAACST
jgi:dimethylamine/trimethylamine dehydrogenase